MVKQLKIFTLLFAGLFLLSSFKTVVKYGYYRYWESSKDRPGHFGIRGSRYKLAFYYGNGLKSSNYKPGEESKLYWDFHDLQADPLEIHNGYKDKKYQEIIANMKKEIIHQRSLLGDTDKGNGEISNYC